MIRFERRSVFLRQATVLFAGLLLASPEGKAKTLVSIELVLAVDTSLSVDDNEYNLQMKGMANAFRSPEIISLIGQHRGVAVTLFQWNSRIDENFVIPWHLLDSPTSVLVFADKVENAKRDPVRGFTALGKALEYGLHLIAENNYAGRRLKIDLSGDGRSNTGVLPIVPRQQALAQGVTINGLPILIDTFNMDEYFRQNVIAGPDAFIEIATDYQDFADAFFRKLRRELTTIISKHKPTPDETRRSVHNRAPSRIFGQTFKTRLRY